MEIWQLTAEERNKLTEQDLSKYEKAVSYKKHEWAYSPWGGWARGNDLLKELGWTEQTRLDGHRRYITMVKPKYCKSCSNILCDSQKFNDQCFQCGKKPM